MASRNGKRQGHGMSRRHAMLLAMLAAACMVFLSGCLGVQRDPKSVLPGNAPASWENQTLGVPMG